MFSITFNLNKTKLVYISHIYKLIQNVSQIIHIQLIQKLKHITHNLIYGFASSSDTTVGNRKTNATEK